VIEELISALLMRDEPALASDAVNLANRLPGLIDADLIQAGAFLPCEDAQVRALVPQAETRLQAGDRLYCFTVSDLDAGLVDSDIQAFAQSRELERQSSEGNGATYVSETLSLGVVSIPGDVSNPDEPRRALYLLIYREGEF